MQWLTATIGLFHNLAMVRATKATVSKGAPIPGPLVKQTTSISFGLIPLSSNALRSTPLILALWWCAVSLGWNPKKCLRQFFNHTEVNIFYSY